MHWTDDRPRQTPRSADIEPHIEHEFGSRLEPSGFQRMGKRKWVRSQKLPLREIFTISALKGGQYSPAWGFSTGFVPALRSRRFRRQSTNKNAIMDLIIDPIDVSGAVPPQAFSFITGADARIPVDAIRHCAEHFVPRAFADFDRVGSLRDFCQFFDERSQLEYRRFASDMYVQHELVRGFVLLLAGQGEAGREQIRKFCQRMDAEFEDKVLSECIQKAQVWAPPGR